MNELHDSSKISSSLTHLIDTVNCELNLQVYDSNSLRIEYTGSKKGEHGDARSMREHPELCCSEVKLGGKRTSVF